MTLINIKITLRPAFCCILRVYGHFSDLCLRIESENTQAHMWPFILIHVYHMKNVLAKSLKYVLC